ncbi:MAG TPA: M36 family metallopeptidase [Actinomycetota bacterium]|nr:M36 family metallopeptidase [Actinomycetota bacterium]
MSKGISRVIFGVLVALLLVSSATGIASPRKRPGGGGSATGRVFLPNPVADLQDQSLTDQKDADYAALQPAYHEVALTDLDSSGYLVGKWANVVSETGDAAFSSNGSFLYGRSDDRFEQVMAYYWVTESQKYIQSLGFGSSRRPINMESQDVRINQWGVDNSYSWDKHDILRFGKGGVDDAEDAEVILHEYGHAMHDSQVPGLGASGDAGAIGEGFGDYWAVTVSNVLAPTPDAPCVADWDSVSYTSTTPHCLRRTDLEVLYPGDLAASIHRRGQIWSRALWDIRQALGATTADIIILEAQFGFAPDTTMPEAAEVTVATAQSLYNSGVANRVQAAFEARGIL